MKKRYAVSLNKETVDEFQRITKSLGMPPGILSNICDEAVTNVTASMKDFIAIHQSKGSLTLSDFFAVMGKQVGQQLEEIQKEEIQEKTCPKCGKPVHKFHDCNLNPTATPINQKEEKEIANDKKRAATSRKKCA